MGQAAGYAGVVAAVCWQLRVVTKGCEQDISEILQKNLLTGYTQEKVLCIVRALP